MTMLLLANIKKELLLLSRDRLSLLVLFVMPMVLVLILSLIQDDLFRATGGAPTTALFVNLDTGESGLELRNSLQANGALQLVEELGGEFANEVSARKAVFDGDYQFAIIVPATFTTAITQAAKASVQAALRQQESSPSSSQIAIVFDPAVRGVYRSAVINALRLGVTRLELARKSAVFEQLLPEELQRSMAAQLGSVVPMSMLPQVPQLSFEWVGEPIITLDEELAAPEKYATLPTSVQQNVPAWTLFGMFFIVIPLAGTLIRERQEGTLTRLMTMPVSSSSLLLGKISAHLLICMIQFGLMLMVGKCILPLFGTPVLELGSSPLVLLLVAFSAALAACGYGILIGVVARSYDQAAIFGSVSIVVAAALGGVMVPIYVMPRFMQSLSIISPLGWGLDAFLDIFVRHGNLVTVFPRIAALVGFFLLCMLVAMVIFQRWRRGN
ncbi:ABC-2 type transport system permease protein [Desulfuromusa kysingii]|uniref:ABC-2 type transport system permease protein n=1 Tax=Desulfuromusa kysingii TaxID=37625 RepID=A0A1H3VPY0_9BACT|nr:ABC transporter permease [Desulfuromusa kysingii]SDZ76857.1 ABC-2 type transport system permease protein [Desulfuromusa kysingii]